MYDYVFKNLPKLVRSKLDTFSINQLGKFLIFYNKIIFILFIYIVYYRNIIIHVFRPWQNWNRSHRYILKLFRLKLSWTVGSSHLLSECKKNKSMQIDEIMLLKFRIPFYHLLEQ